MYFILAPQFSLISAEIYGSHFWGQVSGICQNNQNLTNTFKWSEIMWITSCSELVWLQIEWLELTWHILHQAVHVPSCMAHHLPCRLCCIAEPASPLQSCHQHELGGSHCQHPQASKASLPQGWGHDGGWGSGPMESSLLQLMQQQFSLVGREIREEFWVIHAALACESGAMAGGLGSCFSPSLSGFPSSSRCCCMAVRQKKIFHSRGGRFDERELNEEDYSDVKRHLEA